MGRTKSGSEKQEEIAWNVGMFEPTVEDTLFLTLFILCDLSKDVIWKRKNIQWIMVKSENYAILLPKSFMVIVIFECNDIFNPSPLGLWEKAGARCPVY